VVIGAQKEDLQSKYGYQIAYIGAFIIFVVYLFKNLLTYC